MIMLFLLLSLCALLLGNRWLKILAVGASLALYVGGTGLLNSAIERWARGGEAQQHTSAFADKQLIVVLGLGVEFQDGKPVVPTYALPRLLKAIEVYRDCQTVSQCTLLISGGPTGETTLTEAEVYQDRILHSAPDLAGHIELEAKSRNTWENARFSSSWAKAHGYGQARLVTSLLHMRRSQSYFAHFDFPTSPEYSEQVVGPTSWLPSAWNLAMVEVLIHEQIGLWRYELYETMGWNVQANIPG
ncbi:YdcF family protein [Pseudomonas amygdali]|uniref:YdcF family protein n=1 Tax=Pseudomonas amygdali pv. lachrymans str. M301315 TaxID=629260 RepID=A0AAD0VA65_PSEAV|nr:YdcF family protein [Pseudomonas amygdali]AXH60173.1 YdcF family protein [Pseudomonas amygdali pv. lachrymans str. M301315]